MHATAHAVIIDRHYIGPLNSLYSFHSRSKTIVELIVAVEILEVFEENDPQEVKISKNTAVVCVTAVLALKEDGVAVYDRVSSESTFFSAVRAPAHSVRSAASLHCCYIAP